MVLFFVCSFSLAEAIPIKSKCSPALGSCPPFDVELLISSRLNENPNDTKPGTFVSEKIDVNISIVIILKYNNC